MALFKYLSKRQQCSLINGPETPPPSSNSANICLQLVGTKLPNLRPPIFLAIRYYPKHTLPTPTSLLPSSFSIQFPFPPPGKNMIPLPFKFISKFFKRGLEFCHLHCEGYTPSSSPSSFSSFPPFFLPSLLLNPIYFPPSYPPLLPLPQSTASLSLPPLSYLQTS